MSCCRKYRIVEKSIPYLRNFQIKKSFKISKKHKIKINILIDRQTNQQDREIERQANKQINKQQIRRMIMQPKIYEKIDNNRSSSFNVFVNLEERKIVHGGEENRSW